MYEENYHDYFLLLTVAQYGLC